MPSLDEPGLSETQKEQLRWNLPKRQGGYGPNGYEPYPAMRYKARLESGRIVCDDPMACQKIVHSAAEDAIATGQGWCIGPQAAIDQLKKEQDAISEAAAERAQLERTRMSEAAQAEARRYADVRDVHVPEIPETPIRRKPGRPPKVVAPE